MLSVVSFHFYHPILVKEKVFLIMTLSYIYMMYFSRISLHCPLLSPLIIIPSSFQPRCFSVFMSDFMWFFCDPVVLLGLLIGGSLQEHGYLDDTTEGNISPSTRNQ